jgi:hypothetical protein
MLWPYLDYNPSRRYGDRRIALMSMFIVIGIIVISSFMGTPGFLVRTAAQIEVGHRFLPGEQAGPVRSIPYDQLLIGTWSTQSVELVPDNAPELQKIMKELAAEVAAVKAVDVVEGKEVRYTNFRAELRIEPAQGVAGEPTVKHITLVVRWDEEPIDIVRQEPGFFLDTYVHRDSNYAATAE